MARFTFPGPYAVKVIDKDGLLAFFSFVDEETELQYRDWRLLEGENGPYIKSPTGKPYEDKNGKKQYPEYVKAAFDKEGKKRPKGNQFFADLFEAVMEEFENRKQGGGKPRSSNAAPSRSAKGAFVPRSRVSADTAFSSGLNDDDDLPF